MREESFSSYAPPMTWGAWQDVASHIGIVNYTLSYSAVGDTIVYGKVKYQSKNGLKEEEFIETISFETGNEVAMIWVCFRGVPLGSAVTGKIST